METTKKIVIDLRRRGNTYSEIQKNLRNKISKSTISFWRKGIILGDSYKKRLKKIQNTNLEKARKKALLINREKRQLYLKNLSDKNIKLIENLDKSIQKIILSILYLGEGAKHKSTPFLALANSNPEIIKLFIKLLKNCYNIDESKFRVRIQCRFDQKTKEVKKFWHKVTGIGLNQFYPTYIDVRTAGKPTKRKEYKGVCTVQYFNTAIQLELELLSGAIIDKIINENGPIV